MENLTFLKSKFRILKKFKAKIKFPKILGQTVNTKKYRGISIIFEKFRTIAGVANDVADQLTW